MSEKAKEKKSPKFADGILLKGKGDAIYLVEGGKKRVVPNVFTFIRMGLNCDDLVYVKDAILDAVPNGAPLPEIAPRSKR